MQIREAPVVLIVVKWLIDRMDVQLFTWGFRHKKEYTGEALLALNQIMRVGLSPRDQAIVTEIVRKSLQFLECEIGHIEGKPIRGGWFDSTRYDELIAAQALYTFGRGLGPSMQPVFWNQLKRYVDYQVTADKEYSIFAVCLAIFCVRSYAENVRAQKIEVLTYRWIDNQPQFDSS